MKKNDGKNGNTEWQQLRAERDDLPADEEQQRDRPRVVDLWLQRKREK